MAYKTDQSPAETPGNRSGSSGPGAAKEGTVQCWVKELHRGAECPRHEEHHAAPEADSDQLRAATRAGPLTTAEVAKEFSVCHSVGIWSRLGRWKSLISGCP